MLEIIHNTVMLRGLYYFRALYEIFQYNGERLLQVGYSGYMTEINCL